MLGAVDQDIQATKASHALAQVTLSIDKRQLNACNIISGGDSKHLIKPRNQICTKGGITLALFVDEQTLIFDVVDLGIGLVAHINSGSYREEANTGKERNHIQPWHNAMRIQV